MAKIVVLSECWLNKFYCLINIPNCSFTLSSRISGCKGGGVGIYVHDSVKFFIKAKSCNNTNLDISNIDYLLVELLELKLAICGMYCPPKTPLNNVVSLMELLRLSVNKKCQIVFAGDYNHNLLGDTAEDFLVVLHVNFLHPVFTIPTRVTPISATLIDNFMYDISMLPIQSSVIVHDISDHYPILLLLQIPDNNYAFRRNYSKHNKDLFSAKLMNADWTHLYTLTDTNAAFIYFLKKLNDNIMNHFRLYI